MRKLECVIDAFMVEQKEEKLSVNMNVFYNISYHVVMNNLESNNYRKKKKLSEITFY